MIKTFSVFCVLLVLGCSPAIDRIYIIDPRLPAHDKTHAIKLFVFGHGPTCEYEVVGVVNARQRRGISMEELTEDMRSEARKMGGDAVIDFSLGSVTDRSIGVVGNGMIVAKQKHRGTLSGTIIRWRDLTCTN